MGSEMCIRDRALIELYRAWDKPQEAAKWQAELLQVTNSQ